MRIRAITPAFAIVCLLAPAVRAEDPKPAPDAPPGAVQFEIRSLTAELGKGGEVLFLRSEPAPAPEGQPFTIQLEAQNVLKLNVEMKGEKAGFLGVVLQPATPVLQQQLKLPKGVGLIVERVEQGSPAEAAGLKENDVLHKLDDQLLIDEHQTSVLVRMRKAGDEVKLTVIREGESKTLTAKLVEKELPPLRPQVMPAPNVRPFPGPFNARTLPMPPGIGTGPLEIQRADRPREGNPRPEGDRRPDNSPRREGDRRREDDARPNPERRPDGDRPPEPGQSGAQTKVDFQLSYADDQHVLNFSHKEGGRYLVARAKGGAVLFEGLVDTPEQREKLPTDLREKVEKIRFPEVQLNGPRRGDRDRPDRRADSEERGRDGRNPRDRDDDDED